MFVRKKRNKSGSYSFHIVQKVKGKFIFVKSIGSALEPDDINSLEILAHVELDRIRQQGSFDFSYEQDKQYIQQLRSHVQNLKITGPELILGKLYDEIGFNKIKDDLLRHLVLCRVCYPGSKLKTVDYLNRHHQISYDIDAVYRYLDKLNAEHKDQLQDISYEHTLQLFGGQLSIVFYDVTTLYFEAAEEDELRRIGFSKDGKSQNPQIVLGLLVSLEGYPLAFEMFEGNKFEGQTIIPVVNHFKNKYKLNNLVIVADAGLLSFENIKALSELLYQYILGARIKNETKIIQEKILSKTWHNGHIHSFQKEPGIKLIVSYSQARAINDKKNRDKGLKRLEKAIQSGKLNKHHINNRGYNKYLKLNGEIDISIDYEKYQDDAKWDGLKGYITNTDLQNSEVIANYKNLWQIEKAFRISKTDLKVRPIFHRLKHRIEAHLIIAFCSYKLYKELERQLGNKKTGLSPNKAIEIMQSIYTLTTTLPVSRQTEHIILVKTEEQKQLLTHFEVKF